MSHANWLMVVGVVLSMLFLGSERSDAADETDHGPAPAGTVEVREVIITANRVATAAEKVGSSATVVTGEQMKQTGAMQAFEPLQRAAGVEVRQAGGPGSQASIFLRGTNSNHTRVMLDGIDLSDPSSANAIVPLEFLQTGALDRIEVIRGPQSALYGSDAIGGAVNLITPRGHGKPTFRYQQIYGDYNTNIERVSSQGGNDFGHYFVHFGRMEADGFSHAVGNGERDPYRNVTVNSRFGITPTEEFEADFFVHYLQAENEFDGFTSTDSAQTDSDRLFFKARPRLHLWDDRWTATVNLAYTGHERDTLDGGTTRFRGRSFEADWQNDIQILDDHLVTTGLVYRYETGDQSGGFTPFDDQRDQLGFYLQDQIQLGERVTFIPGFRIDHFSDFGTQATYRLAGVYHHLETDTFVRASVGTGFNAPAFNQLGGFGANPDLDPEKSFGFDIGLEQRFWNGLASLGATYFYNDFDDMIVAIDTGGFVFENFNIEQALTQGVEVFGQVQPIEGLTVRASYTYTDSEAQQIVAFSSLALSEGGRLLRRPLHKVGLDVVYLFWEERASVAATLLHVSERDDVGGKADAYTTVNLAGSVKVHEHVELTGRIVNLFNEDYQDIFGFNAPGISAYGGVTISF